jgi:hypothetical protein
MRTTGDQARGAADQESGTLANEDRADCPLDRKRAARLYGGTERIVSYLTEALVAQGHDVTLFAPQKALEDRITALGRTVSWTDIIADLNSLTETEIEQDGKRFVVRSAPVASPLPRTVRQAVDD